MKKKSIAYPLVSFLRPRSINTKPRKKISTKKYFNYLKKEKKSNIRIKKGEGYPAEFVSSSRTSIK
jgi:hypothetical protein